MGNSYIGQGTVQRSNCYGLPCDGGVTKPIATIGRKTVDLFDGAVSRPTGSAASGTTG
jgi:hypothetical protein